MTWWFYPMGVGANSRLSTWNGLRGKTPLVMDVSTASCGVLTWLTHVSTSIRMTMSRSGSANAGMHGHIS